MLLHWFDELPFRVRSARRAARAVATTSGTPVHLSCAVVNALETEWLFEDAVFGELPALVVGEAQQLGLDPVVVLAQQWPGAVVARRTARDPESVVLIHPRAHRRVRARHEVTTVL